MLLTLQKGEREAKQENPQEDQQAEGKEDLDINEFIHLIDTLFHDWVADKEKKLSFHEWVFKLLIFYDDCWEAHRNETH